MQLWKGDVPLSRNEKGSHRRAFEVEQAVEALVATASTTALGWLALAYHNIVLVLLAPLTMGVQVVNNELPYRWMMLM